MQTSLHTCLEWAMCFLVHSPSSRLHLPSSLKDQQMLCLVATLMTVDCFPADGFLGLDWQWLLEAPTPKDLLCPGA